MELSPQSAGSEWKKGKFRPAYVFYGEDEAGKLAALAELRSALALDPFNISEFAGDDASAGELLSSLNTAPMFSDRRLAVVRTMKFSPAARKEFAQYLRSPLDSAVVVVFSDEKKADFKDSLFSAVSELGGLVGFKPLRDGEAVSRLREAARAGGLELSSEAAQRIVDEAGTEWGILQGELSKLLLFARGKKSAGLEDVNACLGYRRESNPWDFPRALESRSPVALRLMLRMLEEGAEPFQLLGQIKGVLNSQLKAKRLAQTGVPAVQMARELRQPEFRVAEFARQAEKLSEARLLGELRRCLDAETDLKSKSWLDPEVELESLVAGVCR